MKTVKVIFRNGVFVPLEKIEIPEGTEGITVYLDSRKRDKKPSWWHQLDIEEKKKEALLEFSKKLAEKVAFVDIKVVAENEELEIFVIVLDEFESLKPVMETALSLYEDLGVYLPVQVISKRKLLRWKEQRNKVYDLIKKGVSIK